MGGHELSLSVSIALSIDDALLIIFHLSLEVYNFFLEIVDNCVLFIYMEAMASLLDFRS